MYLIKFKKEFLYFFQRSGYLTYPDVSTNQLTGRILDSSARLYGKWFKKIAKTESAQCQKRNRIIQCKGSSTSGISRHLASKHDIRLKNKEPVSENNNVLSSKSENKTKTNHTILKFTKRQLMSEIVSRLAAKDDFFNFIRESLKSRDYSLLKDKEIK
jgi:hypothetical protein